MCSLHECYGERIVTKGAFFWGYSGYSYFGLGIIESVHGISISKRSLIHSGNGTLMVEVT